MAGLKAAVGRAYAVDGRDASTQAIHQGFADLGSREVAAAFLFASHDYDINEVLSGATAQLGNTPIFGFSTSGEFAEDGSNRRSVVAALLSGEGIEAQAEWIPDFTSNMQVAVERMTRELHLTSQENATLLVAADGLSAEGEDLCKRLPFGRYTLAGCLAGGDLRLGRTFQIGGAQAGTGGLAAALLHGVLRVGVGTAHGWRPVGAYFRVTTSQGPWVRTLDHVPAAEMYSQLFGFKPREWGFPPLNTLVRLYPLGIENGQKPLKVRAPLRVETDGSLRMSTPVDENCVAQLLVGSRESCMEAAHQATERALEKLEGAKPVLALVFTDVSWQMLLEGQLSSEIHAVQEILGEDVPIAGGYTFGQIARSPESDLPEFLNQHIEVVIFGAR
ncbi:MAG: FIST C-terminal domain-containing protein [Anaerolineales bacterium]|nr:FIST C-terminal domain-containing protein [Anaerolineales bacterium]